MGLREKVALLIVAFIFVQINYVGCGSKANNFKSPMRMISKPKRTKWTQNKSLVKPVANDETFKKRYNFPEVDYPLPPTFISTSYYNPKLDYTKNQVVTQPRESMKNIAQQNINKKNRKYNGNFKSPNKSFYVTYPEDKGTQIPVCLNGQDLFPSVDYPIDASEMWKRHYWERILNTKPEVIQNVNKMSTNSKAKMKLSAKQAIAKNALKRNLSTIDTKVPINHKENCEETSSSIKEGSVYNPVASNADKQSKIAISALTNEKLNATRECSDNFHIESNRTVNSETNNNKSNSSSTSNSGLSSYYRKHINEELYSIAQVTASPIETSFNLDYVTPMPTLSPLTTVAFSNINNKAIENDPRCIQTSRSSESDSREDRAEEIGLDMTADEMGCTVIYPEVFSSLTTSTMAPYSSVDSAWMDPELDNHTLNTYSDEVEQYYILV